MSDLLCVSQCQGNVLKSPWKRTATRAHSQPSCIKHCMRYNSHNAQEVKMGLLVLEKFLLNMEKGKLNKVFLDLSKAFDTINQPVMKLNDLTHAV